MAMTIQTKQLFEYQKQLQYQRHLDRLDSIHNERRKVGRRDTIDEMHRIRNKSANYHTQKQLSSINHENQKLLSKLLQISKRKSGPNAYKSKIVYEYNNPARKKREQEIKDKNEMLAERMLKKESEFDHNKVFREIEEYEKIKLNLMKSKKLKLFPQITEKNRKNSRLQNNRTVSYDNESSEERVTPQL